MIVTSKFITEIIKVDSSLSSIKTSISFKLSTTSIIINDLNLSKNDYIEIDNNKININALIADNSLCIIKYEPALNIPVISHSINAVSMFKTFGIDSNLKTNQNYNLTVKLKDQTVNTNFSSKCSPYFSTVKKIREDIGELGESISDDVINFLIYQNSKELVEYLRQNFTGAVQYVGSDILINYSTINLNISGSGSFLPNNAVAPFIKQWVRYKTDIDITNAIYLTLSGKEIQINKKIGSLDINKRYKLPAIKNILDVFRQNFITYDSMLQGNNAISNSFVKGGTSSPYPISTRRSF